MINKKNTINKKGRIRIDSAFSYFVNILVYASASPSEIPKITIPAITANTHKY